MDFGLNKNMMSMVTVIYFEDSNGYIIDNRPKSSCNGKVVEIEGKKYKLTEV
jgi:DNA/RNA endonuclease YhcR with UshA esterase domain